MRTALRKMGNSSGVIIPKAILNALGAAEGDPMDVNVEEGRIVLAPVRGGTRAGWAAAAEAIAADDDAADWRRFGNDGDASLTW
jgi:antitoxin MazE